MTKRIAAIVLAFVLLIGAAFGTQVNAFAADSIVVDFGDMAGKAGDVDVDTYITSSDLIVLKQILIGVADAQSEKTADANEDKSVDVRDLVNLKKIMADKEAAYFADGITVLNGSADDLTTYIYKINSSGLTVRESEIVLGDTGREMVLTQLSDFHLIGMTDEDRADEQLATSYANRKTAFPNSLANAKKAMEYASFYGKTVITGDATDYLSKGSFNLLKAVIGNKDANVAIGNHEFRKVWYGSYMDTIQESIRYNTVQENWPYNNIHYHSEILDNKVMIVVMNNGAIMHSYQNYYAGEFTATDALGNEMTGTMDKFLAADMATAKEKGYAMLIFQHCAISTGKVEDEAVTSIVGGGTSDFYKRYAGGPDVPEPNGFTNHAAGNAIYKLITENANIVKGIYTGHVHAHYYTEVLAKSTPDAADYDTVIPQYSLSCNDYDNGNAMKITVKY